MIDLRTLRPHRWEIEAAARDLWEDRGRPVGQDARIWADAEAALLTERYRNLARGR